MMGVEQRFWQYVVKGPGCWNWTGCLCKGYGNFTLRDAPCQRRNIAAHRFAYQVAVGPIPDGLELDHLCRNTRCVNPAHLEPVTKRENVLRGVGAAAKNIRKTHCPQGHPYSPENTHAYGRTRVCKLCQRKAVRRWHQQQRDKRSLSK